VSVGDGTTPTLHLTNLLLLDPTENEALRKNSEFKLAFGFRKRNWRKYQLAAERVTVEISWRQADCDTDNIPAGLSLARRSK
jgi:hypothetical protein